MSDDDSKEEHAGKGAEPSGPKGDGSETKAEDKGEHINPSAPEDSNATPGSTGDK